MTIQKVAGQKDPTFSWFLGMPDRFKWLEAPPERPGPPLGRPAGPEIFFHQKFFSTKNTNNGAPNCFWSKKIDFGPSKDPQTGPFGPKMAWKWPKWDSKTA